MFEIIDKEEKRRQSDRENKKPTNTTNKQTNKQTDFHPIPKFFCSESCRTG